MRREEVGSRKREVAAEQERWEAEMKEHHEICGRLKLRAQLQAPSFRDY